MTDIKIDRKDITDIMDLWHSNGGLGIAQVNGKCYWSIDHDDRWMEWNEIPESLYNALKTFNTDWHAQVDAIKPQGA